ncbi:MAG: ABC transporter substrate-binding protein [Thermodesulfobacteriota bacterium]|nr:ABC transporter substrate-binding protein [Thermodesulfobacteriota bacterium]
MKNLRTFYFSTRNHGPYGWPWRTILCISLAGLLWLGLEDACAKGENRDEGALVLGMSTALTGPTAVLGINMRTGVLAAIHEKNQSGNTRGHKASLTSLDDGYEPTRTAPNMRRLIDKERVLAVIGNVGTPTAVAAIPIANGSKTPFYGAFTGAGVLRKTPPDRYVINYRASYAEETTSMVNALINHGGLEPHEIGFFTQRDAYGDAGFVGGITALKRHGLKNEDAIIHTRYERNTMAVENAVADMILVKPPPRAVIMVGAYAPCAAFIKRAKEFGLEAIFLNVSFVGAEPLAQKLGKAGDGVIVTQVVPHFNSKVPIVDQYRKALRSYDPSTKPTFGSLEGYIATKIFFRAVDTIEAPITRESIVDALEGLGEFDIGLKEQLRLGPDEHQACHKVWPTVLRGNEIVSFDWEELSARLLRR